MTITIRPGVSSDVDQIARVLVDTWRSTFRGRVNDTFLDAMTYDGQALRHHRTIQLEAVAYFVACDGDRQVIGFVSGGPIRHAFEGYEAELYALYVREAYQDQRIGARLVTALMQAMVERDFPRMLVWVLANNPCAPFYERMGARPLATKPITLGSEVLDQVAYVWDNLGAR